MDDGTVQLLCTGDVLLGRHPTRIPDRLDGSKFSPRAVWQDIVREAIDRDVDARLYRWCKATASGLDPEGEADNFPVFYLPASPFKR